MKTCLEFYDNDFLFNIYKNHEQILKTSKLSERKLKLMSEYENEILDLYDRFRLALTTGKYFYLINILNNFIKNSKKI